MEIVVLEQREVEVLRVIPAQVRHDARRIAESESRLWVVANEGIYFATAESQAQSVIKLLRFSNGSVKTVADYDGRLPGSFSSLTISPIGNWLLFPVVTQRSSEATFWPINMPKGTVVEFISTYDNSAKTKFNPNPARTIRWGEKTTDEMMQGRIFYESATEDLNLKMKKGRVVTSQKRQAKPSNSIVGRRRVTLRLPQSV